jgi:hypothetical protein
MLADLKLPAEALAVSVGSHPEHGSLISVAIAGVPDGERAALQRQVNERLDPLVMHHEVVWR